MKLTTILRLSIFSLLLFPNLALWESSGDLAGSPSGPNQEVKSPLEQLPLPTSPDAAPIHELIDATQNAARLLKEGTPKAALVAQERLMLIVARAFSTNGLLYAAQLQALASIYLELADYPKVQPLLARALEISEASADAYGMARVQNLLGLLQQRLGHLQRAEAHFLLGLDIQKTQAQPDPTDRASLIGNLASLYSDLGNDKKSEQMYWDALEIYRATLGPDDPGTATALNNLGYFFSSKGDFAQAEEFYKNSLRITESQPKPNQLQLATTLRNLASLYCDMMDFTTATSLLERVVRITKENLDPDSPQTAANLEQIAVIYQRTGRSLEGLAMLRVAAQIRTDRQGIEHPETAASLANLASASFANGDTQTASKVLNQVLNTQLKVLGSNHVSVASTLNGLGCVEFGASRITTALSFYERAFQIDSSLLGTNHPDTIVDLHNLAVTELLTGDATRAIATGRDLARAEEQVVANVFSCTSERQRLTWQEARPPFSVPCSLGDPNLIAQVVLRRKSLVLDSLIEDQQVTSQLQHSAEDSLRLRSARERVLSYAFGSPEQMENSGDDWKSGARKAQETLEQVEHELARKVAALGKTRRALAINLTEVQEALKPDTVLVEYVRYAQAAATNHWQHRYGALLIGKSRPPTWIALETPATILEEDIEQFQEIMDGDYVGDDELRRLLSRISNRIWAPVEAALPPGTDGAIISPDGALNFVPFATLQMADGKFLVEKLRVAYVASGRDLVLPRRTNMGRSVSVWANPLYNQDVIDPPELAGSGSQKATEIAHRSPWLALNGTGAEATSLAVETLALGLGLVETVTAENATEAALKTIQHPYLLHLATHAFFWPAPGPENRTRGWGVRALAGSEFGTTLVNPMYRSGLALTGANCTLAKWDLGRPAPPSDDGILLAAEIANLDLDGTWLVVLSACNTARGHSWNGEGVLGLQRALVQAGAQNILLTLWSVSDRYSQDLILQFYELAIRSEDPVWALNEVQRRELVRIRSSGSGLLMAVRLAGPYLIITASGWPR